MKRKRGGALPQRIVVEPAGDTAAAATAGPYAAFFASGFRPGRDASCSWSVHSSKDKQVLVACTARTARHLRACPRTASPWSAAYASQAFGRAVLAHSGLFQCQAPQWGS
jgi:hypothetical protein